MPCIPTTTNGCCWPNYNERKIVVLDGIGKLKVPWSCTHGGCGVRREQDTPVPSLDLDVFWVIENNSTSRALQLDPRVLFSMKLVGSQHGVLENKFLTFRNVLRNPKATHIPKCCGIQEKTECSNKLKCTIGEFKSMSAEIPYVTLNHWHYPAGG